MLFLTFPFHLFSQLCSLFTSFLSHSHSFINTFFSCLNHFSCIWFDDSLITSYDLFSTIPFYCYLSFILCSLSFIWNTNISFIQVSDTFYYYLMMMETLHLYSVLPSSDCNVGVTLMSLMALAKTRLVWPRVAAVLVTSASIIPPMR